jgi:BirA family transcriptional regulator, biotin operon repressor / biotin---[acetyl-CoA-carboxylase] ligase
MVRLLLPSVYRDVQIAADRSALDAAQTEALAGGEEGTFFWSDRSDKLDAALLLQPDRPRRETLPVIYVAALAFADALGAFAPPPAPISFEWPYGVLIDDALIGALSFACAPSGADTLPAWAVLGFELALTANAEEPGQRPHSTSIAEQGFERFSVPALLEGFSRHFLAWLNRWDTEGTPPVMAEWSRRAFGATLNPTIVLSGGGSATPLGLDIAGNLRVRQNGRERTLPLEAALADQVIRG